MSVPEIGMPLNEFLGSSVTLASSGQSLCGNVLGMCGFEVSEQSGGAVSGPGNDIASLALTNTAKPVTPSFG